MHRILIIDDKKSMAEMLARTFQAEGFSVLTAYSVKDGLKLVQQGELDVVITDLKLPDGDGIKVLKAAKEYFPLVPVILMTAHGSIELAVRAVKDGAYDFIAKPFNPDHLLIIVRRALAEGASRKENMVLKSEFSRFLDMPEIIGVGKAWEMVMSKVHKVAPMKTTVLVLGESGTGKELVARSIHHLSPRSKESFVAVNCAAIPKDLIENELFGHEKGAFTGAQDIKPGRFELADKGTIFLDEIGDMDLTLQSKLLRVLQEREIERVGGTRAIRVDLRVIAASNKNLRSEVAAERFREDLFYRLNVFPIVVPALRERPEDIIPLAKHFIGLFSKDMNKQPPVMTPDAERLITAYEWKGNVRELKNVIERAVIMCEGLKLGVEHLNIAEARSVPIIPADSSLRAVSENAVRSAEKTRIQEALRKTGGNKSRAAEILKVSYKTLLTKIKEYGIDGKD
ncbi:MAG TPA: sigma-54 dependent transcriptional regulator [Dissulfurispiraceae bacterium]|nr:sigma-54 dependent transcriptional regulator [Dissulfurispiraceae bacterium]